MAEVEYGIVEPVENQVLNQLFEAESLTERVRNRKIDFIFLRYISNLNLKTKVRMLFKFAKDHEEDLVVKCRSDELFRTRFLDLSEISLKSIRPEAALLFRRVSMLCFFSSITSVDEIARIVRVFDDCQIESNLEVSLHFRLAQPEIREEIYGLAKILEPLKGFHVSNINITNGNQDTDFYLGDLNVLAFKEFEVWHQCLNGFDLSGFVMDMVDSEAFVHFKHLTSMDLCEQGLNVIKAGAFKGLEMLSSLCLNDNLLLNFEEGTFDDLLNLTVLYLADNSLKDLQLGLFRKLEKLSKLGLARNPLSTDLHEDTFCGLENLTWLDLADTPLAGIVNLKSLPAIKKHMKNVELALDYSVEIFG
jgi:Leucine-rich repeat (LRR) protein